MTPEQRRIQELEKQVETLMRFMKSFENAGQFSPQNAVTLSKVIVSPSEKTAGSATRSVSEAGTSSYNVMFPPTGFILIDGKNVPYID